MLKNIKSNILTNRQHIQTYVCLATLALGTIMHIHAASLEDPTSQALNFGQTTQGNVTFFSAREVIYDAANELLEARGRVIIKTGSQTIKADVIQYDTSQDTIKALGNVSIEAPDGSLAKTEAITLNSDFSEAVIPKMVTRLADGSRITAQKTIRSQDRYNTFYNATYTTCASCLIRKTPPIWSLRSKKVRHDQEKKYITAQNVFFDVKGQPILWVPFFAYPDPTVKRKTGFLTPTLSFDDTDGFHVKLPYNIVISDYSDLLLTPYIYEKRDPMLFYRLRQNFDGGGIVVKGSFTRDKELTESYAPSLEVPLFRWHMDAELRAQIGDRWFVSGQYRDVSDTYYFDDYDISSDIDKAGFLHSNLILQYRGMNSWFQGELHNFKPQTTGLDQEYIPLVFPHLNYKHILEKPVLGGTVDLELDAFALHQKRAVDITDFSTPLPRRSSFGAHAAEETMRLASKINWSNFFVNPWGFEHQTDANLTVLSWKTKDYFVSGENLSGTKTLIRPTISSSLSYPLIRSTKNTSLIVTPIMQAVWSPEYDPDDYIGIPNTDSQTFDLSAVNLFTPNRFSGIDRDEGGFRLNYGIKSYFTLNNVESSLVFGQVYRPTGYENFSKNSGLDSKFSDYVGRFNLNYDKSFSFDGMLRLDQDDFSVRRADISSMIGPASFKIGAGYTWFENLDNPNILPTENLTLNLKTQLTPQILLQGSLSKDLQWEEDQFSDIKTSIFWENESLLLGAYFKREWEKDETFEDSYGIQLSLKTLGDFNLDF